MLKNIVNSDQLHYVINQVSQESGEAPDIIQEEASVILEEMAYRLQISTVRFFAFTLSKAFKTLLQNVCVNEEGIQRLQQAIQEHPVVLRPSHRSYMDFLLMSYILHPYDLALPVIIAAGKPGGPGAVCADRQSRPSGAEALSFLDWPDHAPTAKVVSSSLALHRSLVCVSGGRVSLVVGEPQGPVTPEEALFNWAVNVLSCASYRKQVLHVFLWPAMLAVAMHTSASSKKGL
ncbi:hypothetical protein J4Q44_G00319870 [Coregonus suidteri]|uniref:Phospholipid/glycerol acyltransferase domain-containing protein n=1 Tax=Coregonus suidteri TaxID=861788 RepID=A0AAN8KY40_9TELE